MMPLTIFGIVPPLVGLRHARTVPERLSLGGGVLETLLHLDSFVGSYQLAQNICVAQGGIKGLVSTSLGIIYILADDPPIPLVEGVLPQDPVGMPKAVENEPGPVSSRSHGHLHAAILVCNSLFVFGTGR